ncbi:MAG: choice-of-anchor Q domain-containing protein [Pirellulaceae bacterium]
MFGSLSVSDATISGNVANRAGGGIEAETGTTTNLTNVFLTMNNAGVSPDATAAPGNGGGLHITGAGNATITGGEVTDNVAALEGGGLWNGAGTMTIDGTLIAGNTASGPAADDGGGGIFNNGGTLNVTGATITDNLADGAAGSGGGLFTLAGTVMVTSTTLSFNSANRAGGGIEIVNGDLSLIDSNLISNDVDGGAGTPAPGNGGGLHVSGDTATVTIDGGSVFNNLAASEGGGLWNQAGSTLVVQNGTLIDSNEAFGNDATNGGGGIFNNGGVVNVTGTATTISNNFASGSAGSGGGIFNGNLVGPGGTVFGSLSVSDATISGNVANRAGGGIEAETGTTTNLTNVFLTMNNAGVSPDATAAPGNGGGLHITGAGNATITGGEVTDNVAALEGGGLWNGAGTMTIDGTLIAGNTASGPAADDGGGGIFNNGGTIVLLDSLLISNSADGVNGSGGGIFNLGGSVTASDVFFGVNLANRAGGAIETSGGTFVISNSTITNNQALTSPGNGGGLHISGASTVDIADSTVSLNSAQLEGGGLWNSATGILNVLRTAVDNNSAASGGGIFSDGAGGILTVDASTVSRNLATGDGGGILSEGGSLTALNSTISGNIAMNGGGIQQLDGLVDLTSTTVANNAATTDGGGVNVVGGTLSALNSLIADNTAASGPDIRGNLNSGGHNLLGNTNGTSLTGTMTGNLVNVNPLLGPLQDNGGSTETHALLPSSPALDAGSNAVPPVDQRAIARPQGAAFDIGAFEATSSGLAGSRLSRADVNRDGMVSPVDALLVVNRLNSRLEGESNPESLAEDVSGDGIVSAVDALLVINILNTAGEHAAVQPSSSSQAARELAISQATDWLEDLRRRTELDLDSETELIEALADHWLRRA